MNRRQWKELCKTNSKAAYFWYNKVKKILKSKEFESDERTDLNATDIHHLRDTEEQRKYNDEHYEMFGYIIDENGNDQFNYGDYVVFWTKEHHDMYHHCSEETKRKISIANKGRKRAPFSEVHRKRISDSKKGKRGKSHSEETKRKISNGNKGKIRTDEQRARISALRIGKFCGENHPMYGKRLSEEVKSKISKSHKGKHHSDETKNKISETSKERMACVKEEYHKYKSDGGAMMWNEFQSYLSNR